MSIAGYELQIRDVTNSGSPIVVDVGNVLAHDFTGLTENTQYGIKVRSYDYGANRSEWSTEELQTTLVAPSPLLDFSWLGYHDAERLLGLSNGDAVNTFSDFSGLTHHFTKLSGQTAPTFMTAATELNNLKGVRFDADSEGLYADWNATGQCTVFLVAYFTLNNGFFQGFLANTPLTWKFRDDTSSQFLFTQSGSTRATFGETTGAHIIRIEHAATTTKVFLDGVEVTDDNTSTTKPGDMYIGLFPFNQSGVESPFIIGFIGCSDGLITGTDADDVEAYFMTRYGL